MISDALDRDADAVLRFLEGEGRALESVTATDLLGRFAFGFNRTDDVLERLVARGVLAAPAGQRSLRRRYTVLLDRGQGGQEGAEDTALGPRSRLSALAERSLAPALSA